MVSMFSLECTLNTNRLNPWFALSLLLTAGCGAQKGIGQAGSCQAGVPDVGGSVAQAGAGGQVSEVAEAGKNTVQFSLLERQVVDISISTPGLALAVIVIRDSNGNAVRTIKTTNSPSGEIPGTGVEAIGLCWNGCDDDGRPQPTGSYTAEITATDGDPLQVACAFTPGAATENITIRGNLDPSAQPVTFTPLMGIPQASRCAATWMRLRCLPSSIPTTCKRRRTSVPPSRYTTGSARPSILRYSSA